MKLYSGDLSPYSAKVRMQIYAKGIDDITLERPAGFGTPEWWKTSPIGRIPVLELDDGELIPESEVIAEYLEEVFPTPRLLGRDAARDGGDPHRVAPGRHLPAQQHVHARRPDAPLDPQRGHARPAGRAR